MAEVRFDLENFPTSESAQRMLEYVTEHFYDKSYVGKWLFQVMGLEYDEARKIIAEELMDQFFPETATWALRYHEEKWQLPIRENLPYEERRRLIYEKRDYRAPMTPIKIEKYLRDMTGMEVVVADIHDPGRFGYVPDHPNRFKVYFVGDQTLDTKAAKAMLDKLKQSHTVYRINDRREIDFDFRDWEKLALHNVRFPYGMDYWGVWYHNGEVLHNGAMLHGSGRRYGILVRLSSIRYAFFTEESLDGPGIIQRFGFITEEDINTGVLFGFGMDFWNVTLHNGAAEHDGGILHNQKRGKMRLAISLKTGAEVEEIWNNMTILTKTRNQYYHDGRHLHDGSTVHRTVYHKEVVE